MGFFKKEGKDSTKKSPKILTGSDNGRWYFDSENIMVHFLMHIASWMLSVERLGCFQSEFYMSTSKKL